MDIIDTVAKDLGFSYRFEIVPDNEYGSLNKITKQWNGLIRELREQVMSVSHNLVLNEYLLFLFSLKPVRSQQNVHAMWILYETRDISVS